jgi:GNAT superfamily N-acetyltransferase
MDSALHPAHLTWRVTSDAARVHALHRAILANTPAGMVRPDPLAHFEAHTGACGQTLACFDHDGALAGYGILGLASPTVVHLAQLLSAEAARVAVLDGAAALPEWRGHGLHRRLVALRIELARTLGRSVVVASVAPANIRSLRGLLDSGMLVRRFAMLYGGLPRLVLQRELARSPPPPVAQLSVPARDAAAHRSAIDAGLTGYACRQSADGAWLVDYGLI